MIPVVIPFYKNKRQLDKCLDHIRVQALQTEIFVRDNSEDNVYFTAAVNEGIKMFLGRHGWNYLIVLNQDMYLLPDSINEMILFMKSHPKCGIGMPVQVSDKDNQYATFAGGLQAFPIGIAFVGSTRIFSEDAEITWADAGCLILRREMIQEIGLFDENLRFVGSDSDYCFTARSRGWQVWRIGKARGVHEKGQSATPYCGHILNLIKAEDMIYFAEKWLKGGLYRSLAHESENCGIDTVQKEVAHLITNRDKLKELVA